MVLENLNTKMYSLNVYQEFIEKEKIIITI